MRKNNNYSPLRSFVLVLIQELYYYSSCHSEQFQKQEKSSIILSKKPILPRKASFFSHNIFYLLLSSIKQDQRLLNFHSHTSHLLHRLRKRDNKTSATISIRENFATNGDALRCKTERKIQESNERKKKKKENRLDRSRTNLISCVKRYFDVASWNTETFYRDIHPSISPPPLSPFSSPSLVNQSVSSSLLAFSSSSSLLLL